MRLWGKILPLAAAAVLWTAADAAPVAAQTGSVTGTVVDVTSGRPLESAQVFIPALNMGGLTNTQGRFLLLNIPAGTHEVRVELIGYNAMTQEVTVTAGQASTLEFRLNSTALRLQELVVTGVAGETPRVKLPFTVESVDFTEMAVPSPSADGLIAGKVPGASVTRGSGQPGSDSGILLRGPTTITGSQSPLIIIDGVITDNTLADISSLDVESIEMVKGAAGASLYGSRAQNGVVQIRTRRGSGLSVDQSRIIVRNEYGLNSLEGETPLSQNHPYEMNANGQIVNADGDAIDIRYFRDTSGNICSPVLDPTGSGGCVPPNPVLQSGSSATTFQDGAYPYQLYNNLDAVFDPGSYYSGFVAAEGRTGSTNYRASFVHQTEAGVVDLNDGFKLSGFRLNLDHQIRDNLTASVSTYYSKSYQEDLGGSPFYNLVFMAPFANLLERDTLTAGVSPCSDAGCYIWRPDPLSQEENPLYRMELIDLRDDRQRFLGSATVTWSPLTWFDLEGQFSIDQSSFWENNLTPAGLFSDQGGSSLGTLSRSQSHGQDLNGSITASINRTFGDLTTRTKIRYLLEDGHNEFFSVSGSDFIAQGVPDLNNTDPDRFSGSSSISDVIAEGYFFVTGLDYQGKYIGDVVVRRDGSSLFGEDERWQTYYRASGAWRIAQESWWPFEDINEFKLRYSIGTAGGRPRFAAQYETYSISGGRLIPANLGNKLLKPELSTEQEVGMEMVLFNKVSTGLTYATSTVEDQLLLAPLAAPAGFGAQWRNAGTIESNTWEAWVEAAIVDGPDFTWSSRVNFDRTQQEITEFNIPAYRSGYFYIREGEQLGTIYGKRWASSCSDLSAGTDCSQFQVNDDGLLVYTGGSAYTDGVAQGLWGQSAGLPNGAGDTLSYNWGRPIAVVTDEGGDFNQIGSTQPDFQLSLSNTFRWRNLSLYTLIDGRFGHNVYNQTRNYAYRDNRSGDQDQLGKADGSKKPLAYYQDLYNTNAVSGWFVEDGTWVKIREASLRYTFGQDQVDSWFGRLGVSGMSLNVIGRNLLTFTDYQGYDPEVSQGTSGTGSESLSAVDNFGYPNFRTFSAALEIIF
jgi:TonB-linked SusC/RagA family outer membrane protein